MKIEIIGTNIGPPAAVLPITNVMYGNEIGTSRRLAFEKTFHEIFV